MKPNTDIIGFMRELQRQNDVTLAAMARQTPEYTRKLAAALLIAVNALETAPEQIRNAMEGHKGQAYRVATQVCGEALSRIKSL